jgi:hypothetical protein
MVINNVTALAKTARGVRSLRKCRPDWDVSGPELEAGWERGESDRLYRYDKTYGQLFREQE